MNVAESFYYQYILPYALKILVAIAIFFVGKWIARFLSMIMEKMMLKAKINHSLVTFAKNVTYYALLIMVAIAALNKLGVETTSFVALVGAAGLAVGLALQGSLSNFAAGVLILLFQPFDVGDVIEAGGAAPGTVKEIQTFTTIIITEDGKTVIIPNSKVTGDKIIVHKKI